MQNKIPKCRSVRAQTRFQEAGVPRRGLLLYAVWFDWIISVPAPNRRVLSQGQILTVSIEGLSDGPVQVFSRKRLVQEIGNSELVQF